MDDVDKVMATTAGEFARRMVFARLADWSREVGERFQVSIAEANFGKGPIRVLWYSGDSFGFSAEYRAPDWAKLLELMDAEPEGFNYAHEWDLKMSAEELLAPDED